MVFRSNDIEAGTSRGRGAKDQVTHSGRLDTRELDLARNRALTRSNINRVLVLPHQRNDFLVNVKRPLLGHAEENVGQARHIDALAHHSSGSKNYLHRNSPY